MLYKSTMWNYQIVLFFREWTCTCISLGVWFSLFQLFSKHSVNYRHLKSSKNFVLIAHVLSIWLQPKQIQCRERLICCSLTTFSCSKTPKHEARAACRLMAWKRNNENGNISTTWSTSRLVHRWTKFTFAELLLRFTSIYNHNNYFQILSAKIYEYFYRPASGLVLKKNVGWRQLLTFQISDWKRELRFLSF